MAETFTHRKHPWWLPVKCKDSTLLPLTLWFSSSSIPATVCSHLWQQRRQETSAKWPLSGTRASLFIIVIVTIIIIIVNINRESMEESIPMLQMWAGWVPVLNSDRCQRWILTILKIRLSFSIVTSIRDNLHSSRCIISTERILGGVIYQSIKTEIQINFPNY